MTTLPIINRQGLPRVRQSRPVVQPGVVPSLYANQIPTTEPIPGLPTPLAPNVPRRVAKPIPQQANEIMINPMDRRYMQTIVRDMEQDIPDIEIDEAIITTYSSEEIKKISVAEIKYPNDEGFNSVNDPRMGSIKHDIVCSTCEMQDTQCPGHFGYIPLIEPIYNPLFFDVIIRVLRCVCNSCGGLFLTRDEIAEDKFKLRSLSGYDRLKEIESQSLKRECVRDHVPTNQFIGTVCDPYPHEIMTDMGPVAPCVPNPNYDSKASKEKGKIIYKCSYGDDLETPHVRQISEVYKILNQITEEEASILGFNTNLRAHPRNYIVKNLLVTPPCSRSSAVVDGTETPHSHTAVYKSIVKHNNMAAQYKSVNPKEYAETVDKISAEYRKLLMRGGGGSIGGLEFKSFMDLIQGKEGLIRNNMLGKRVNFAARAIIGPDPTLRFGQVGIPREIAKILTVPEVVTPDNVEFFKSLLRKGEINRVKIGSGNNRGQMVSVSATSTQNIRPGDIVHRWLRDGDYIIINRQPTLHKLGMMGAEVKVIEGLTTRLHMSYTSPFNADFDGDEMNLHVPQTPEAMEEVKTIMNVTNCLMNAQNNAPAMAMVFDTLLVYLMTQPGIEIRESTWFDALMIMSNQTQLATLDKRLRKHSVPKFTGKALFSALLPEDFYYVSKTDDNNVLIIDGVLVSGYITKKEIGISSKSMVIDIFKRYGRDRLVDFYTDVPWVVNKYLMQRGFTVGLKDCFPIRPAAHERLREVMAEVRQFAESLKFNPEDPNEVRRQENAIVARINQAMAIGNQVMMSVIPLDNNLKYASISGAKGSNLNMAQITTSVGQQSLFGERLKPTMTGGTRCLPYFEEGSTDPEARGFCPNSFSMGLSPAESFFHQTAGREGLILTAVTTGRVGYSHRKIAKMLEDLLVFFDGSVRNSNGDIIQFAYGEDGIDGAQLQEVVIGTDKITSFLNIAQVIGQINSMFV